MTETYYSGVYWPGRPEPLEAYARRAELLFRSLSSVDPSLARWFEQAASRDAAIHGEFVPDAETLRGLFAKKKYRPADDEVFFAAWTGESSASSGVNFACGSPSPETVDLCVFTPPAKGAVAGRLLSATALTRVMSAMVLAWEPEWGVFTSDNHRDAVSEFADTGTFVGWGTYLSRNRGQVPPLPSAVRVEQIEDKGNLILLTPERFTVSNPEHMALAEAVREQLDRAGMLKPIQAQP